MAADVLRPVGHRFRPPRPASAEIRALRALLEIFWRGAAAIFADISSPIALAFLRRYPTPDSAARFCTKRLASFLAQHSYCGRHTPAELPDGQIVMCFPRAGRICAAGIFAGLGDVRERFFIEDQRAAEASAAPVTHASGKSRSVIFR